MLSRLSLVRLRLRLPSLVRLSSSVPVPRSTPPPVPKVQPNVPLSVSDSILPLDDLSPPSVLAQAPNNAARSVARSSSVEWSGNGRGLQRREGRRRLIDEADRLPPLSLFSSSLPSRTGGLQVKPLENSPTPTQDSNRPSSNINLSPLVRWR